MTVHCCGTACCTHVHGRLLLQEGGSCHLTLSTYQRWTFAQLAMAVMATAGTAQDEQFSLPLELRRGLPFGHIFHCGLQVCERQAGITV